MSHLASPAAPSMNLRLSLVPDLSPDVLEVITRLVRGHGVLAMPTESYYALGASPFDAGAVQRVCDIKGRSQDNPILVLIGDRRQLTGLVADVPPAAEALMQHFWPGPLTLVLPAVSHLPRVLTAGTGTVGVRLSSASNSYTASPACRPTDRHERQSNGPTCRLFGCSSRGRPGQGCGCDLRWGGHSGRSAIYSGRCDRPHSSLARRAHWSPGHPRPARCARIPVRLIRSLTI